MLRLALILIGVIICIVLIRRLKKKEISAKNKKRLGITGLVSLILFLVISGKAHWLVALGAGALGAARGLVPLLFRHWPHLAALYRYRRSKDQERPHKGYGSNQQQTPPSNRSKMTKAQACEILGVQSQASKAEIQTAYKKLMQKCHPDRGGSHYIAAQLNAAKETLLG